MAPSRPTGQSGRPTARTSFPELLTIGEAARVMGVGRSAAYDLARIWRETGGQAGLPNVSVGHSLRVPANALEAMLGRPMVVIPGRKSRRAGKARPRGVGDMREPVSDQHEDQNQEHTNDNNEQIDQPEQISEQTSRQVTESVQPMSKRPIDTCHPFGEAASAPVAPSPAGGGSRGSAGC